MSPSTDPLYYSALCADVDMFELVQEFLAELPERLCRLQGAIESGDLSEAARLAHQLKGAGGSYGYPLMTPLAARLEAQALSGMSDAELLNTLDDLINLAGRLRTAPGA